MTTIPRTFADVPWHRKSGTITVFILAGFCLFPPLLLAACVVCLTGDVYNDRRREDGSLSRWSRLNKFAAVIILPVQVMVLADRAGGTAGDLIALSGMGGWLLAIAVATVRMFRLPRAAPGPPPAVPRPSPETGRLEQAAVSDGGRGPAADGLFRLMNGDTPEGSYTADTLGRMLRDGFVPEDRMVLAADGRRLSLGDLVSERIARPTEDITVPSGQTRGTGHGPSPRAAMIVRYGCLLAAVMAGLAFVMLR